jgi:hypothetical protein
MTHQWDEFSKSLAEDSLPRRQSLRLLGAALAGAVLGPFGGSAAWAGKQDPCQAFCNRCSNKTQRNQCLAACQACNGNTSRLAGSCGNYTCCATAVCNGACSDLRSNPNCGACGNDCRVYGETCCGSYCADLANDVENCGRCGVRCDLTGPYEYGACVEGVCVYECVDGALDCGDGMCTYLGSDPNNCGGCGQVCAEGEVCSGGACCNPTISDCFGSSDPCVFPFIMCGGGCVDPTSDPDNCGGCGVRCGETAVCIGGFCESGW